MFVIYFKIKEGKPVSIIILFNNDSDMTAFKSLVVMDCESSGLPSIGAKVKITELSLVGVLVDHVLQSHKRGEGTPRVLQKISVCFYPQKRIDFEASEITGENCVLGILTYK